MKRPARLIDNNEYRVPRVQHSGRLSFLKFFMRYPIFLLAFGPPIFRSNEGIDATKGKLDFWIILQVGLLSLIALRAILRLATTQSILIPKQIRSILKYAFLLGLLFLASSTYSTSRIVSAAYSILYFATLICVVEFIVDVYRDPPNWMQCLFQLRIIALLLFIVVIFTVFFNPEIVMAVIPGAGIRLGGGTVAPVTVICPMIAIISAYSFLHSLESRFRSVLFFLVGLAGTLITQSRGAELALLFTFSLVAVQWARTSRRSANLVIAGIMVSILLSGAVVGFMGANRIWNTVNRGQDVEGIATGSGRTVIWSFVVRYCLTHPQGMGYIAGFRNIFKEYFALGLEVDVTHIGSAHNSFVQVLADAGWLALALYLIMVTKIVRIGWRFAKKQVFSNYALERDIHHPLECALLLLILCFAVGMDSDHFVVPLKTPFYFQNIIIAIILGISARMIVASRTRYISSSE